MTAADNTTSKAFSPGTSQGMMAIVGAILVLVAAPLIYFVSVAFLLLLVGAIGVQLLALQGGGAKYALVGRAMAVNGALLIASLFVVGIINDFTSASGQALKMDAVGLGFTGVHVMLGIGLMLLDHHRAMQTAT